MEKLIYPHIQKNDYHVKILKNLFAGSISENILFLQGLYYCNILSDNESLFLNQLYEIALCDQEHCQLLANLIKHSGGDPTYAGGNGISLSGTMIDYSKNIGSMLTEMISLKEKILIEYALATKKIQDKKIISSINVIIADERSHKEILEKLLQKYKNECEK